MIARHQKKSRQEQGDFRDWHAEGCPQLILAAVKPEDRVTQQGSNPVLLFQTTG